MTARERLQTLLAPEVLAALEELVAERVAAEIDSVADGNGSPWLSLRQAAGYLGLSERTIERELSRGRLRSSTVGPRRLLHREELDAYVRGDGGGRSANHATPPPGSRVDGANHA